MAINSENYFSNSLPSGEASVGFGIDLFSNSELPKAAIGTRVKRQDGNIYRYAQFGAATKAGLIVAPDLNESARAYSANVVVATSSAFQQDSETTGTYPGMVGSKYVVLQLGTQAADKFAGGYITISSGTGLGYTYRIKGNAASGTATVLELYDHIQVGLDATGDIAIAPSKYANVEPALAGNTQNSLAVGVSVTAMTNNYYGWICTRGVIGIADSGGQTTGKLVILSNTDAGHVEAYGNGASTQTASGLVALLNVQVIGDVVLASATSGHSIINVTGLGD